MVACITMGRQSVHLTEGPCWSALITNCNYYEVISDKLDLYKTLKLFREFYRVHENLKSVLGSNLDRNLHIEQKEAFGQPKLGF